MSTPTPITALTVYVAGYIRPANKCGCGLLLEATAPGFLLDREIGHQISQASAVQADLQAAIAGLSSIIPHRLPIRLVVHSPAVYKLLERAGDTYVAPIKNNEQLSRRLRKLFVGYPHITLELVQDDPKLQRAQELAKQAALHGHTDTNTRYHN